MVRNIVIYYDLLYQVRGRTTHTNNGCSANKSFKSEECWHCDRNTVQLTIDKSCLPAFSPAPLPFKPEL